jgi:hypothetical protein
MTINASIWRTSLKLSASIKGFNPSVIDTVELGLMTSIDFGISLYWMRTLIFEAELIFDVIRCNCKTNLAISVQCKGFKS